MDARYRAWDGRQDPFDGAVDVGDVLDGLAGDLLEGVGGREALRRLLRRGLGDARGLDALRRRAASERDRIRRALPRDGPLDRVADELDRIVETERDELTQRNDPFRELALDAVPPDPAGRFQALRRYDFASSEARGMFAELEARLRQEFLDSYFRDLARGLGQVTADDLAAVAAMLAELNELVAARDRGDDVDLDGFLDRHGDWFPERPSSLDELLESLARRMAAMSRMLASLSPQQRAQLEALASSVLDDLDLQFQMAQLEANLRQLAPSLPWDRVVGDGDLDGLADGDTPIDRYLDEVERLGELEDLESALRGDYAGATLEDVDEDALRRHLGEDAVTDLERLRRIERELERSGALRRRDGELELTPRGARLLGERALAALLERIRRQRAVHAVGADPEPTGQSRPWVFGDRERIAVQRTVHNAVLREVGAGSWSATSRGGGGRGRRPLRLRPDDFEVVEEEVRPRTATALLLDLSYSMPLQGHLVPAKRMALALHALIAGRHRQDSLHLIGFSDYARPMRPADLGAPGFERVYGTNMQHAFLLARRTLADDPRPIKQVVMVTDGEPTAHLVEDRAVFHWPPVPETLERTLREAMRLARSGIALNIFLLEDAPGLVAFADRLASVTGGQVFQMRGDELGRFVLRSYAATRGG